LGFIVLGLGVLTTAQGNTPRDGQGGVKISGAQELLVVPFIYSISALQISLAFSNQRGEGEWVTGGA